MKYKVDWSSPRQGIQSTTVDAINMTAAREQVESMYAHIEGFKAFCVSPVFEQNRDSDPQQSYYSNSPGNNYHIGDGDDDFSATIAAGFIVIGGILILVGLFNLPVGILAMILGGGIGWTGWKLGNWMNDKWGI